jgi:putative flippase GtrA
LVLKTLSQGNWKLIVSLVFRKYIVAGLVCNALSLGLYYFFTFALNIDPRCALFMACAVMFPIAYWINRRWTFNSSPAWLPSFLQYGAGYGASLLMQLAILHVSTLVIGLPHYFAAPGGLAIATGFFFLVQKHIVFRDLCEQRCPHV